MHSSESDLDGRLFYVRTLVIIQNIIIDGFIELFGDWFDFYGQVGEDLLDLFEEFYWQDCEVDGFLVGWQTFEDLRGYWFKQFDDPMGIVDYFNEVQKYVIFLILIELGWQNSTILFGDVVEQMWALKQWLGRDIVVIGSITLCYMLIQAALVDEYRLFVYLVVQGCGCWLFFDGFVLLRFELLETKVFASGIMYLCYAMW